MRRLKLKILVGLVVTFPLFAVASEIVPGIEKSRYQRAEREVLSTFPQAPQRIAMSPVRLDHFSASFNGETCGNGLPDEGEECDDGNNDAGDGCSPNCQIPTLVCKPGEPATITTNLVEDPGFELDNNSWAASGTAFPPLCTPQLCGLDLAPEGDAYVWIAGGIAIEGNEASVSQALLIPEDASTLTFQWAAAYSTGLDACESPSGDFLELFIDSVQVFRSPDPCEAVFPFVTETIDLVALGLNDNQIHTLEFHGVNVDDAQDPGAGFTNIFLDNVAMLVIRDNPDGPTDTVCVETYCSDSLLSPAEQCDDGNFEDGDGCSGECLIEQPNFVCSDPDTTAYDSLCEPMEDAVQHGSFEDTRGRPTAAWSLFRFDSNDELQVCSEVLCPQLAENPASDGAFAAVFASSEGQAQNSLFQDLVIPVSATQLEFELSVVSCDSIEDVLQIYIDGFLTYARNCDSLTNGFESQVVDISQYADGSERRLEISTISAFGNSGGSLMIVDEVSIPLPDVAVPMAGVCELLNPACNGVESFDSGIPSNWSVINLSVDPVDGWGTTDDAVCLSENAAGLPGQFNQLLSNNLTTGSNVAACADSDATGQIDEDVVAGSATLMDTYLCSPAMDLSTITGPEYTFNTNYQSRNNALDDNETPDDSSDDIDNDFLRVLVGTEAPTELTVGDYSVAYTVQDHEDDDLLLTGPQEISVNLEGVLEGVPEGYVCFHYQGRFAWFAQVDNAALRGADCALAPVDTDGDGVFDSTDNCTLVPNAAQIDTNNDGIGNRCDTDVDNNCITAFIDISQFVALFGVGLGDPLYNENFDTDSSGSINFSDYFIFTSYFQAPPGPSANPCVPGLGT